MPLYKRKNIDWYRHLAFACVGGFFGAYAIMSRGGVMGSAQTVNLLELVIDALYGRGFNVLEHLGAFLLYAAATMLTVIDGTGMCGGCRLSLRRLRRWRNASSRRRRRS